jgi:PAS domain S-box-containing protein
MLDLISNTLNVIAKLSNSSTSYLFKATKTDFEILSYAGNDPSNYESLNSILLNLHKLSGSDRITYEGDPIIKETASSLAIKSFQISHVLNSSEKLFDIYLVLLSSKSENYGNSSSEALSKMIKTLNYQVREWANISELIEDDAETNMIYPFDSNGENFVDQRIFFNISEDLLFILDREGKFSKVNKKGAEAINQSVGKLIGKHFLDIIEDSNKIKVQELLKEVLLSKKEISFEVILTDDLGENFFYQMSIKTICTSDKICGLAGAAKNISQIKNWEAIINDLKPKLIESERLLRIERRRAHQQKSLLVELNKLKNEFISNISHELRTPLASIIGFSETIESDDNLPEDMRKDFNRIILSEGKRLAKLINDVLELSRIESGTIALNKSNFDLAELIKETIECFKTDLEERSILLTTEFPAEEIFLFADREKILQVFSGVIGNAIKFTDKNGRITVIVNNLMKEAEVIISDTGAGIPEKDLPFIFEKFYRVQRKDSENPGTGLGLVFVKQIVDLHKGYVEIQSEVNKGTSVVIRLLKSLKINLNSGS